MNNWHKQKINPLEWIESCFSVVPRHIVFDPEVRPQYRIRRQCSHDGTQGFTQELIGKALIEPIILQGSYYAPEEPKEGLKSVKYTVGWLWLLTVVGRVDVPCGRVMGEKQRVVLPVACELVY